MCHEARIRQFQAQVGESLRSTQHCDCAEPRCSRGSFRARLRAVYAHGTLVGTKAIGCIFTCLLLISIIVWIDDSSTTVVENAPATSPSSLPVATTSSVTAVDG